MSEAPKAEAKKGGGGGSKLMPLLFCAFNVIGAGGAGFLVYSSTLGHKKPVITEEQEETARVESLDETALYPLVYTMDPFTVNLDGEPKRTIRLEVNIEMLGKDGFEEVVDNDMRAQARDTIVRLLNSKTFSDVETIQGKLFLKDQIMVSLNGLLKNGVVKDVYYTDFVVQ